MANTSINTLPAINPSFFTALRTFLRDEDSARDGERFFHFVVSGGLHATSATMISPAFATIAYTQSGQRVAQESAAIDYATVGAAANDTAWVIIAADDVAVTDLDNFVRVGSSAYFVDVTSGSQPTLPANAAWLMQVTIAASAITVVTDLRSHSPLDAAVQPYMPEGLGAILTTTGALLHQFRTVRNFGATGNGVTDDRAAFALADAAGARLVPAGTYAIASDITITKLSFLPGAMIVPAAGVTVTLNAIDAAPTQRIFDADGVTTGRVRLGFTQTIYTRWWGTTGAAADDVTLPLQAAIEAVAAHIDYRPTVQLESGYHRITTTLNLTTGAGIGVYAAQNFFHHWMRLAGSGVAGNTTILADTGDTPAVDISGSQGIELQDFSIVSTGMATPSIMGILQGAEVAANQVHNLHLRNVKIILQDHATAHGTLGTIGLCNFGGENCSYTDTWIVANLPVLFTATPTLTTTFGGTGLTVASPYVALVASHSVGANAFLGDNTWIRLEQRAPTVALYNVNSLWLGNTYFQEFPGASLGTSGNIGVWLGGDNTNVTVQGTVENIDTIFTLRGNLYNSTLTVVTAGSGGAVTWFDMATPFDGPPTSLDGVVGHFSNADSGADTAFSTLNPSPQVINNVITIRNSRLVFPTITTHTPSLPPGNLMRRTSGTIVQSQNFTSQIALNSQKLSLGQIALGSGDGVITTTVAKIRLPTAVANQNGLAVAAQVDALLSYGTPDNAGHSARWLDTRWAFVRDATANDDADVANNASPVGAEDTLTIAGPVHVFTASGGPPATEYFVQASATTAGGGSTLYWSGDVELRYSAGYAEVPVLRPDE